MLSNSKRLFSSSNQYKPIQQNVFGKELKLCCNDSMTGLYGTKAGKHTVCSVITSENGSNDLSSNIGDKRYLSASQWKQAYDDGKAPPVDLDATNINVLNDVNLEILSQFDIKNYPQ